MAGDQDSQGPGIPNHGEGKAPDGQGLPSSKPTPPGQTPIAGPTTGTKDKPMPSLDRHIVVPAFRATLITYCSMFLITFAIHCEGAVHGSFPITVLVGFSGAVFGWLAGFLVSPYDPADQSRLNRISSLLSVFASGFLLAKVESSITTVSSDLLKEPLYGVRILNFVCNFVTTAVSVYLYRLYGVGSPTQKDQTREPEKKVVSDSGSELLGQAK